MTVDGLDDNAIRAILQTTRRIAMVGASDRPQRASNHVQAFLQAHGYEVIPVNPRLAGRQIHGSRVVATLAEAAPFDMADLFRASAHVAPFVDEAIRLGARTVWMQLGVIDRDAADRARAAGLAVAMDRCPAIEVPRLCIPVLV